MFYIQTTRQPSRLEGNQSQQLAYAAQEFGQEVILDQYKFFSPDMDLSFLPQDQPIIFHGSITTALQVGRQKLPYYPFAWFTEENLLCKTYYEHWHEYLLNEDYGFYPLKYIAGNLKMIAEKHGHDDYFFIRPDTNDKAFTGEVVDYHKFAFRFDEETAEVKKGTNSTELSGDLMCLVAKPRRIWAEFRTVVSRGVFITGSQYKDGSALIVDTHCPIEVVDLVETASQKWSPDSIFCLDVAETPDGFKIIECGSVNCAGYYMCDIHKIVQEMISYIA